MEPVKPLIGRQAKIGTALQNIVGGVALQDAPVEVVNRAKFATSSLTVDDKKVAADSLDDRASETDGHVVGTFEPAGAVEINAQEDGSFLDFLTMHGGTPIVTDIAAAGNFRAYHEHLLKNLNSYRCGTIVEKILDRHQIFWGARVNRLSMGVRKTQDKVIFAQSDIMALNSVVNSSVATAGDPDAEPPVAAALGAPADTGMLTAATSLQPYLAAVRAKLTRAGSQWTGAQEFNYVSDAQLARVDELNGYRGMGTYSPGKKVTADVTIYFSTDAEYKRFTGVSALGALIFGPGWDVIEEDVELIIPGAIRGASPNIFQPEIRLGLYRAVITGPFERQIGKDAIMLKFGLAPQHKDSEGTDSYIKVKSLVPASYYTAPRTAMCNIPANAGSAYTAPPKVV